MAPTPLAYFGGEFIPASEAKVGVMTHALHYGTAVFEGIRCNWNPEKEKLFIFRPLEHFKRLAEGASILRMQLPFTPEELVNITIDLVERTGYREDMYIRPLAYKSAERVANLKLHELDDGLTIIVVPFGEYIDVPVVRCMTASWRRIDETMMPPRVKLSAGYVNSILAKTDAVLAGFDEAIFLNNDGHVAEGSGENLFVVKDGALVTPPLTANILPGITRSCIMQMAKDELGLETVERPIGRAELYLAEEVFLTGTAAHVTPMGELDHRTIGTGAAGPITKSLQDIYFKAIRGGLDKYRDWCVEVVPAPLAKV
jgi:branched-chain amino acid aminotransferase